MLAVLPGEIDDELMLIIPGPLQLAVLAMLWRRERATLAQIHQAVSFDYKPVALTTVSTTVRRLVQRGWAERASHGMYRAAISRPELIDLITEHIERA